MKRSNDRVINAVIERKEEAPIYYENDLSAKSQAKKKRARFQKENEHEERQKCSEEKTGEGKKETYSLRNCGSGIQSKRFNARDSFEWLSLIDFVSGSVGGSLC
jgi:hypothetical protein